jgi:hypothetical protein
MAILNKLSDRKVLIIAAVLFVLAAVGFGLFKLNIGVDYMDATVFVTQLDHEESVATVTANTDNIQMPSRVEKEGTSKFYLYFQDLTPDQIAAIKSRFANVQPGVLSLDMYYYTPAREYYLKDRVVLIAGFAMILGLVYLLYILKGLKLKREQVLSLILSEWLLLLFGFAVLLGFVSLLGKLGVVMDDPFFTFTLGSFMVLLLFSIYSLLRIRDLLQLEKFEKLSLLYARLKNKYWPEGVFLFCTGLLVVGLPWVVVERTVALGALQMLWALLISLGIFFYVRPALSRAIIALYARSKRLASSHFWQKQW